MVSSASQEPTEININLMPDELSGTAGQAFGRVLTVGRYLIIFTEIIALAIFLLSIKLSADKNDLKDQIQILGAQISAQRDFEKDFLTTQQRIEEIKRLEGSYL